MSTTFAIFKTIPKVDEYNQPIEEHHEDEYAEIAFRSSRGIRFLIHPAIVSALDSDIPVFPIDNTAQGIYTVGDLKKERYNLDRTL